MAARWTLTSRGRFREYVRLDRQRREAGLSLEEMHRWQALKRFLSIHFAPDRPEKVDEQRDSVRVPTRIKVSFAADPDLAHCLMTNVSRGGMFVRTDHPLRAQDHVHAGDPRRVAAAQDRRAGRGGLRGRRAPRSRARSAGWGCASSRWRPRSRSSCASCTRVWCAEEAGVG
jgi:hypothetical protein